MQYMLVLASETPVLFWSLSVEKVLWWLLRGRNARLAEGEPHRPDILTLSPTLEYQNEVFLVNSD